MAPIIPNNPRKINVLFGGFRPLSDTLPAMMGRGKGFQVLIINFSLNLQSNVIKGNFSLAEKYVNFTDAKRMHFCYVG